jgi:hypothetical protein
VKIVEDQVFRLELSPEDGLDKSMKSWERVGADS